MTEQPPLRGPQLKGPKAPSSALSGLDTVMQVASMPLKVLKVVVNPLAAPKVAMELLPGGAAGLGCLKEATALLSKVGDFLKNPLKTTLGLAMGVAKGEGPLPGADKIGSLPGKAAEATSNAMEGGAGVMDAAGTGMQAGGQSMIGLGKSLQAIPIAGQIVGIPIIAAGVATKTAGVVTKVSAKAVRATGKVLRGVGKITAKVGEMAGKALKPVIKASKHAGRTLKAVRRTTKPLARVKNAVGGAGQAVTALTALTKLQGQAAKGDVAAMASTTKTAASGVRQGISRGFQRGQKGPQRAQGLLSHLARRETPLKPQATRLKPSAPKVEARASIGKLRAVGKRVLQVPAKALQRLQAGGQALGHLARVQDQAAKGDVSGIAQSTASTAQASSRAAALPKRGASANPREIFNTLTPKKAASLNYYRQSRLKG